MGSEVITTLHGDASHLEERAGRSLRLAAIFRRQPELAGTFYEANPELYRSLDAILDDPDIDLVCELMGGMDTARRAIEGALARGKHVVSANKKLLAYSWPELLAQAEKQDVQMRFEAAVAGGIPILNSMASGTHGERMHEMRGVINGTTNYILTQMEGKHLEYGQCLQMAKQAKYAESDPSDDILGRDACQKLSLLIAYAFGKHISPDQIPTTGIVDVALKDIEHAGSMNPPMRVKLVARAEVVDGQIIARVGPELVLASSPIGQIPANLNAIELRSDLNAKGNFFQGEGAGGKPTAASVLSDIVNIARTSEQGYVSPFGRPVQEGHNQPDKRPHTFYVRFVIHDAVGVVHDMTAVLKRHGINLNSIVQLPYAEKMLDNLPFFITVEDTDEATLQRALGEIAALPFNAETPQYIRFERDDLWRKKEDDRGAAQDEAETA